MSDPEHKSHPSPSRRFRWSDALLAGLAVLGLLLYVWQYDGQDPSATLRYVDEQALVDEAASWLRENAYDTRAYAVSVKLQRDEDLLDGLQRRLGRQEAVRVLRDDTAGQTPAHYWEVVWEGPDEEGDQEVKYTVRLTTSGQVFAFVNEGGEGGFGRRNQEAIDALAAELPDSEWGRLDELPRSDPQAADTLGTPPASAFPGDFLPDDARQAELERDTLERAPSDRARRIRIDSTAAVAMARYHLDRTSLGADRFRVDSLQYAERGPAPIRVQFVADEERTGYETRVRVETSPLGVLLGLRPTFMQELPTRGAQAASDGVLTVQEQDDESAGLGLTMGISSALLVLLVILCVIVFFRRLSAHAIDSSAALRDGALLGLLGGVAVFAAVFPQLGEDVEQAWQGYLFSGVGAVFAALGIGVLVFLVSGATDSLSRETWVEKIRTTTLLRQFTLRNKPVGRALLRGLAVALVLNGVFMLFLMLVPGSRLVYSTSDMIYDRTLSFFVSAVGSSAWSGFLHLAAVLLGAGVFLHRRASKPGVLIGAATILFALLMINPQPLAPFGHALASSAALGMVLALTFWRYDFLTCLVAYVLSYALWGSSPGWAVEGSPLAIDAGLTYVAMGLVGLVGLVGVRSGRDGGSIPQYVPDYIVELSRQERLTRELEIARQVQSSFLPRRMPEMPGLDLAGMCLAAQEVGGDYYDFVRLDGHRLALIIGDVSGKGIQAAFYMTLAKGFFRTLCREFDSPAEVLRRMNRLFWENSERGTFISVIYGIIDLRRRTFTFARAGHNPVILKRSPSQNSELIRPFGLALGLVSDERFDATIEEQVLSVRTGDVLVFYTDGFSEAMNNKQEMYGDERLVKKVAEFGKLDADGILRVISEDVHRFVEQAGRHDDMTMVIVKVGPRLEQEHAPGSDPDSSSDASPPLT